MEAYLNGRSSEQMNYRKNLIASFSWPICVSRNCHFKLVYRNWRWDRNYFWLCPMAGCWLRFTAYISWKGLSFWQLVIENGKTLPLIVIGLVWFGDRPCNGNQILHMTKNHLGQHILREGKNCFVDILQIKYFSWYM